MADVYIGRAILVHLKSPQNTIIQGLVANVIQQTSTLVLQDVLIVNTGERLPGCTLEGSQIAEIKIVDAPPPVQPSTNAPSHSFPPAHHVPTPTSLPSAEPPQAQPSQNFADPAILSVGRKPSVAVDMPPQEAPSTPMKTAINRLPRNTSPFIGEPGQSPSSKGPVPTKYNSAATLSAPFSGLEIGNTEPLDDTDDQTMVQESVRRVSLSKTRTGKPLEGSADPKKSIRKKKGKKNTAAAPNTETTLDVPRRAPELTKKQNGTGQYKGRGWRQTPILQDGTLSPGNVEHSRTPGVIGGEMGLQAASSSQKKTRRQLAVDATNGWATEDADNIQDLPEFDFAENLSKFDKRSVFDAIRNEDTTADEDRLVSHNRLPTRPGTYGGKNIHPSENVLDAPRQIKRSDADSESSEGDPFDLVDSGRNSRRAMSRTSLKRKPQRSGSGILDEGSHPSSASNLLSRSRTSLGRPTYSSSHATGSPNPTRFTPSESPTPPDRVNLQAHFRIVSNNLVCPSITPGLMAAVEESAEVDYGLTPDILNENSGRGLAEVALLAINPGGRRLAKENLNVNSKPVLVVLAGNHKAGARAMAAARHLLSRGPRVIVCMLGFDRPSVDLEPVLRRQVDLFKKLGGAVRGWVDVSRYLKGLDAPPEIIMDALLAPGRNFDGLGQEDQKVCVEMMGWANKSRAQVLAVDCPSGVNGSTGEISILEGEPLEVRAKFVACIGAPRVGLLRAAQRSADYINWQLWVIDIGINKPWKDCEFTGKKGVKFGNEWVAQLKLVPGG
ncbi:YjeF N-terminal domain-like protein [Aulographum hederae CBS 113979]|uniref:Enhancer of mRNA-decapping protein 3 n=1 Tax=Aulographum hederae CBS 113979 TaxID=1176131 RepID=A0A6G1GJ45_9PEZI|nr:YjeF N-terminal domain-like protein [Aulographum hederae CBS 113979]